MDLKVFGWQGLDSYIAYSVVQILRDIAHKEGRTVIATIHQPSSEVFNLFDDVLVMAEGQVAYFGPTKDLISYFGRLGYQCPQYTNPADFLFMDILNFREAIEIIGDNKNGKKPQHSPENLLETWKSSPEKAKWDKERAEALQTGIDPSMLKTRNNFSVQIKYLFNRASKNAFRNPFIVRTKLMETLVTGLIIGLLYLNTYSKSPVVALQNITGVLFFLAVNNVFATTTANLSIFVREKMVFQREYRAGYYTLPAYFISKISVELPFYIVFPTLRVIIIYWMVGLTNTAAAFFIFDAINVLSSLCGFSLGTCLACTFSSLPLALASAPMILLPLMLFSGFFVNSETIPMFLNWIKYISPIKYSFEGMFKTEVTDPSIITQYGFNDNLEVYICAIILVGMVILFLALTYFNIWRLTRK
jgi:ATP-binding cassette subfamily G (WHITE) protein 1